MGLEQANNHLFRLIFHNLIRDIGQSEVRNVWRHQDRRIREREKPNVQQEEGEIEIHQKDSDALGSVPAEGSLSYKTFQGTR